MATHFRDMTGLNPYNLPAVERARAEFAALARAVAERQSDLIEGARRLCPLGYALGIPADDPDFRTLVGFDSETDALPVGSARENWAPHALLAKDAAIREVETRWGEDVRAACARLADLVLRAT